MTMRVGFCLNSRRWVPLMLFERSKCDVGDIGMSCDNCGYYEERKVTPYYKKIMKQMGVKESEMEFK